jgi:6-pyruvoyltetrahydropterin/6-carboxytetrahydropterin synthase
MNTYRVRVSKAYDGDQCEPLHGHNYRTAVSVEGDLGADAYVYNFVPLKRILRAVCDGLDHRMLLPTGNPLLEIAADETAYTVRYQHKTYVFPREDVVQLPIPNTTSECLAAWIGEQIVRELERRGEPLDGLRALEVEVEESFGQRAFCRMALGA